MDGPRTDQEIVQQPQKLDITKLSLIELKALAFDQMSILENAQRNLAILTQEIDKKLKI
jgi:hypothetical protein